MLPIKARWIVAKARLSRVKERKRVIRRKRKTKSKRKKKRRTNNPSNKLKRTKLNKEMNAQ